MLSRKVILLILSVLVLIVISVYGFRSYCARCCDETITEESTIVPCTPTTNIVSRDILDISSKLLRCDRHTYHKVIAGLLTDIRRSKIHSTITSEILSSMLSYDAEIYKDRDKWEVVRLRSYILLTLGETGFPESAIPFLQDALTYVDDRMSAVELASAIEVAGHLGSKGSSFAESIMSAYNRVFSDEEFSLSSYQPACSKENATTIQLEIIKSLGQICDSKDEPALKFLNSVLASSADHGVDKRAIIEAQRSLDIILQKKAESKFKSSSIICPCNKKKKQVKTTDKSIAKDEYAFIEAHERKEIKSKNFSFIDQEGARKKFTGLIDRPTLLTFFYTRCQNDSKCSATISQLASLQNNLTSLSLNNKVKLVAITFEPEHDSPDLLKRYMIDRGVKLGNDAMAIKLDVNDHEALIKELIIPVGYNSGWVNGHGVEAILLDKHKKIVKKYSSSFWNTPELLADLEKLLKEESGE